MGYYNIKTFLILLFLIDAYICFPQVLKYPKKKTKTTIFITRTLFKRITLTHTTTTTKTKTNTVIETSTSTATQTTTNTVFETSTSTTTETITNTVFETATNTLTCSPTQWLSDFSQKDQTWNIIKNSYGKDNRMYELINNKYTMKVYYPNGSYIPSLSNPIGGTGFYASPLFLENAKKVTFEYEVFFPDNFNFVKGGKLPGLFGGNYNCSGGIDLNKGDCFSSRYMFRENGNGELYLYLNKSNQNSHYCDSSNIICNDLYGDSIGRGLFSFETGIWTKLRQTIKLNSIDNFDGEIYIDINDINVVYINDLKLRSYNFTNFIGIFFDTFFGGSTSDWATPFDQYIYYKNFRLNIDEKL